MALIVAVVVAAVTTGVVLVIQHSNGGPSAGDTVLTLRVSTEDGTPASTAVLDTTKHILISRLTAAKVSHPDVTILGTDTVLVTVGPNDVDRVRSLLAAGSLAFRPVLDTVADKPSPGTSGCPAVEQSHVDLGAVLTSAKAKLRSAYDLAASTQSPDRADAAALSAFATLTCTEVTALPAQVQYVTPQIDCARLNGRLPGAVAADPTQHVTACDGKHMKYLLDAAKVSNTDLASATYAFDANAVDWIVQLHFTTAGQAKWTALTRDVTAKGQNANGQNGLVAIVLDNQVLVAPEIMQVITGDAIISGATIDRSHAEAIAAELGSGVLPVTLTISAVQRVH